MKILKRLFDPFQVDAPSWKGNNIQQTFLVDLFGWPVYKAMLGECWYICGLCRACVGAFGGPCSGAVLEGFFQNFFVDVFFGDHLHVLLLHLDWFTKQGHHKSQNLALRFGESIVILRIRFR